MSPLHDHSVISGMLQERAEIAAVKQADMLARQPLPNGPTPAHSPSLQKYPVLRGTVQQRSVRNPELRSERTTPVIPSTASSTRSVVV